MILRERVGFAGVANYEVRRARVAGKIFAIGRLVVAYLLAVQWNLEVKGEIPVYASITANWWIWLFFVSEIVVCVLLVKEKLRYLQHNWFYLMIIALYTPILIRYQPLIDFYQSALVGFVLLLLIPWIDKCRAALSDNRLGTTIISALIIILFSGILISGFDPNIPTPWDGVWWAVVTISTVGYGDVVPLGLLGKVFAILLIFMGLGLFAVLTANFSSIFVRRNVDQKISKEYKEIKHVLEELKLLKNSENNVLELLIDIKARLERFEHNHEGK